MQNETIFNCSPVLIRTPVIASLASLAIGAAVRSSSQRQTTTLPTRQARQNPRAGAPKGKLKNRAYERSDAGNRKAKENVDETYSREWVATPDHLNTPAHLDTPAHLETPHHLGRFQVFKSHRRHNSEIFSIVFILLLF